MLAREHELGVGEQETLAAGHCRRAPVRVLVALAMRADEPFASRR
jgi:hypothetical protein